MPLAHPDGRQRDGGGSVLPPTQAWSIVVPGRRPQAAAAAAGNEVGITGAHSGALQLFPAHLCVGFTCEDREMAWWPGCGCIPGGQGVAGSNPAVPTIIRTVVPRNGNENGATGNDHAAQVGCRLTAGCQALRGARAKRLAGRARDGPTHGDHGRRANVDRRARVTCRCGRSSHRVRRVC